MRVWIIALLAAMPLAAEPPRRAEAFGHIGYFSIAGDEGNLGKAAGYGGTIVLPIAPKFAIDFGVITASTAYAGPFEALDRRRTLVLPSIVWRKGSEKAYFFAGGGLGAQIDRYASVGSQPPHAFSAENTDMELHARTGGVFQLKGRLLFRADLVWAQRYVLPSIVVNAGVGYRF